MPNLAGKVIEKLIRSKLAGAIGTEDLFPRYNSSVLQ